MSSPLPIPCIFDNCSLTLSRVIFSNFIIFQNYSTNFKFFAFLRKFYNNLVYVYQESHALFGKPYVFLIENLENTDAYLYLDADIALRRNARADLRGKVTEATTRPGALPCSPD